MFTYPYVYAAFSSLGTNKVEPTDLYNVINANIPGLFDIGLSATAVSFVFDREISASEKLLLDGYVASHKGTDPSSESSILKDEEGAQAVRLKKSSWHLNFQQRHIRLTTSTGDVVDQNAFGVPFGDCYLEFYELVDGALTKMATPTQQDLDGRCVHTRMVFDPDYELELDKCWLSVPHVLDGADDDAWSAGAVMAHDLPYAFHISGAVPLKFFKGDTAAQFELLSIGGDIEVMQIKPNYLAGNPVPGGHKLALCFNHPAGAKSEFLVSFSHYR